MRAPAAATGGVGRAAGSPAAAGAANYNVQKEQKLLSDSNNNITKYNYYWNNFKTLMQLIR